MNTPTRPNNPGTIQSPKQETITTLKAQQAALNQQFDTLHRNMEDLASAHHEMSSEHRIFMDAIDDPAYSISPMMVARLKSYSIRIFKSRYGPQLETMEERMGLIIPEVQKLRVES